MSRFIIFFLCALTSSLEALNCKRCNTAEQKDPVLGSQYCPACLKQCRSFWDYFIRVSKSKKKYAIEDYQTGYVILDVMTQNSYTFNSRQYAELVFIEFINAAWSNLCNEKYQFKNRELQRLFSSLFKIKYIKPKEHYAHLSYLYRLLKLMCLALYYENPEDFRKNYIRPTNILLKQIDETIIYAEIMLDATKDME